MKLKTLFVSILAATCLGIAACNPKEAPKSSTEPTTSEVEPTTSEEPVASSEEPTSSEEPASSSEEPATSSEEPPTSSEEPPVEVIDPIALTDAALMGYAGTNMSYGDGEGTVGNIKFGFIECGAYGNGIQMRTKNGKSSTIWNKDALPGALKQIKITLNADKQVYANEHALTFYFGANADFTTDYTWVTSVTWDTVADQKSYTIDVNMGGAIYFKLVHSITYSLYVDSVELVFQENIPPPLENILKNVKIQNVFQEYD